MASALRPFCNDLFGALHEVDAIWLLTRMLSEKIVRDRKTNEHLPCVMCGAPYPLPDAVHIIDEREWKRKKECDRQCNGIPLCPNCHRVFDEVLRPYLYKALDAFGATGLPESWKGSNKVTVTELQLPLNADTG